MKTKSIALAFIAAACLQATTIDSLPGLPNSLTGATAAVGVHPFWQPNHPDGSSAVWISYADTGYEGGVYQPNSIPAPAVTITQAFFAAAPGTLTLKVWADDTAWVFLDGNVLADQMGGVPGFFPGSFGLYGRAVAPGAHELTFEVFQGEGLHETHDNPFGLLYTGSVTSSVPEPTSLSIGFGLLMIWCWARMLRKTR